MTSDRLRSLGRLLVLPVLLYVLLRWFEHRNVYQPTPSLWADPSSLGIPYEEVWLTTTDGRRLHAWFLPAADGAAYGDVAVLHCHGNGGNISHRLETYAALRETGVAVLGFDYRGYGRSRGRPNEEGTYRDAQAAWAWLRDRGFEATRIVAFGESLGGGVATELALREPVGAVVLQSTFTSIPDLGAELFPWLPVRAIGRIRYDNLSKLPRIRVPVLVMHGRGDTLIPFHHGERLFAAAGEPKMLWELAGDHNDALDADPRRFLEGPRHLLERLPAAMGPTPR